ncbi:UbiA prenyltransferase [Lentithecium fluviatile CBS 122367]|uniref:UbiA prenyltransferase n=1 Tax=Lentithecium fluviatile CBS 122367 TaxID=1168545 RepID=A0A6G1JDB3_9PLEO|nr:UbiA prenyltransferase [Lentithecium fluviatile CBS 122367]
MPTPKAPTQATNEALAYQYGGNHKTGWLAYLPEHWLPYVQLARLSPPAGLFLVYFPHSFGLIYAAIRQQASPSEVAYAGILLFGGSFFVSNAIHIWNDIVDAPLDAKVERTRHRPIPRGAVSSSAALIFTASQTLGAALFLPMLGGDAIENVIFSAPGFVAWLYYPYAKQHTYWTQAVLGVCLSWGIVIGALSLGVKPYSLRTGKIDIPLLLLFSASTMWTMIYDSVYGFQDLKDDLEAGIYSMPVLFKFNIKRVFWILVVFIAATLAGIGGQDEMGMMYYGITVGGTTACLGLMVAYVDLSSSESCWWWFSKGFWYAGGSIIGGLLAEYTSRVFAI